MSNIHDAGPQTLREAFYVLSTAKDTPDAQLLDDVIRQYPQFKNELTEFAIDVAIDALSDRCAVETAVMENDPSYVSPAVSRAMSYFQNRLHSVTTDAAQGTQTESASADNPFLGLPRNEFRALATRLNANGVFVGKLRDRQVSVATMTPGFLRRVADELGESLDVVKAHFSASQPRPSAQFFKADGKPSIGRQQSFEDAVKNSGLNESQQKFLLDL